MALPSVAAAKKPKLTKAEKKAKKADHNRLKKAKKKQKKFMKKAARAYDNELWDDAIASFELAHDALARADILFNIGRCHENAGDLPAALEYVDRFLSEAEPGKAKDFGGAAAAAQPSFPHDPAPQGGLHLVWRLDRWIVGSRHHGRHEGANPRFGYFFLTWSVTPAGDVLQGDVGSNDAGDSMGNPSFASLGDPHNRLAAAFPSQSADGRVIHPWWTTDLSSASVPATVEALNDEVRTGFDLAWQWPSGRVGMGAIRTPEEGEQVVELIRFNLDRAVLGITPVATAAAFAGTQVVWDGERYVAVFAQSDAADGRFTVAASDVKDLGEVGALRTLSYAEGSHSLQVVSSSEHGFAVAWVDEEAPNGRRGGISLFVGDLGCAPEQ